MANKAWLDAAPPHVTRYLDIKQPAGVNGKSTSGPVKGKNVPTDAPLVEEWPLPPAGSRDSMSSAEIRRREPPPHLQSSSSSAMSDEKRKPQVNGWSKLSISPTASASKTPQPLPPMTNGTSSRVVIGFKPIPSGPRNTARVPAPLPSALSEKKAITSANDSKPRVHPSREAPSPPLQTPPPPPPPQDEFILPPPSPPSSRRTTPSTTLAQAPFLLTSTTDSSSSELLYPFLPPSPASVRANPPESTRHVQGRGNIRVCDPTIHHPSSRSAGGGSGAAKEEPGNTGCGRAFKHEKPITRVDGVWEGKEVDDIQVKDPRLDMDKSVREKGAGSKKNAYKGLYQVRSYEWDDNSPFPKPPPPPDGICISNINPLVTVSQIEHAVSAIGKTKNIDMKLDPRTGMQMGICHVTFHSGEERLQLPAGRNGKKPTMMTLPVPAWQIASKAQKVLNGMSIGLNMGGQKESVMKVVLDGNGDKARKVMEAELERRRRPPPPAVSAAMKSSTSSARPQGASLPSQGPIPGAAPIASVSTHTTAQTPSGQSQSRTPLPPKPEISPPKPYAPLEAPRASSSYSRTGSGGFGMSSSSSSGWSQPRGYKDSLDIGRLPAVSSSSYNSYKMSSAFSTMSHSLNSFVAAPFAKHRARDARPPPPPSRGTRDEDLPHRQSFGSYQDLPSKSSYMNSGRQLPPSALESYHRRSSRSRRSSSVSRTESDGSESEESSDRGRTPSPVYKRGTRRGSDIRATRHHAETRDDAQHVDPDEAEILVSKVRKELLENGRSYIFIDHKSLPIPHKLEDRDRLLVELKDHLKAVRLEKVCSGCDLAFIRIHFDIRILQVTYNLHGWYILFDDDFNAKRTQMVFDKKVMSGRSLALNLKDALSKASIAPGKTSLKSPARARESQKAESPSAKTLLLYSPGLDKNETVKPSNVKRSPMTSKSGTKKQKISRVVSSDDDEVSQVEEKTAPTETSKSVGSIAKELDIAPETVEDALGPSKEGSATATSTDMVDDNTDVQLEVLEEPQEMPFKKTVGKSKRKSDAVGKPAKQPAKKKQKKATSTIAVEEQVFETSVAEDVIMQPPPPTTKAAEPSAKSAKSQKARAPVEPDNLLSLSDLVNFGIAENDEDLYYLRLAAEHSINGTIPDLPPNDEEEGDDEAEPSGPHPSGCARSHGYYKVPEVEKSAYLPQRNRAVAEVEAAATNATAIATSRSTRVNSRRLVQGMEQHKKGNASATDTDLFQFNQLRTRKKQLKFSKSPIHDWGLYAMEHITQGEMVIEYVGEVIRAQVADIREKWYEKTGIGSSYLFRVDDDAVVDATKKGNLGYVWTFAIVIYAKWNIEPGEEITYDYHFPIEQEKIPCLCGSDKCRGYLN
ncbi:hypothetical protein QFC19_002530 [Naganishia cerealis]|uniref:Uncharacterized protein n=1 Tax=Naganishia cerealis TaxID=610337 RepID=A0ACC2WB43_9TREE|nr:hypothetical protein QFC19_002530 [Naganishia cerealis]